MLKVDYRKACCLRSPLCGNRLGWPNIVASDFMPIQVPLNEGTIMPQNNKYVCFRLINWDVISSVEEVI
jgi:hypothetical protein